jgi:hypothetical protein
MVQVFLRFFHDGKMCPLYWTKRQEIFVNRDESISFLRLIDSSDISRADFQTGR